MQKICKKCGISKDVSQFYKSKILKDGYENTCKECRQEQRKKHKHICEVCGISFLSDRKYTRFCSYECSNIHKTKRVKFNCEFCGKEAEKSKYRYDNEKYHYCSSECRSKHISMLMKGKNNPNYKKIKTYCSGCGKEIFVVPSVLKKLKHNFCSYECYQNNIGKFYKGSNNGNYNWNLSEQERNDLRRYSEYYEWRESVFKRDNYTCQCCGSNSGTLRAHHLDGYDWCKDKRTDINNGITLCEKCHDNKYKGSFHRIYGCGNNTREQFEEFIKNKKLLGAS